MGGLPRACGYRFKRQQVLRRRADRRHGSQDGAAELLGAGAQGFTDRSAQPLRLRGSGQRPSKLGRPDLCAADCGYRQLQIAQRHLGPSVRRYGADRDRQEAAGAVSQERCGGKNRRGRVYRISPRFKRLEPAAVPWPAHCAERWRAAVGFRKRSGGDLQRRNRGLSAGREKL